MENKIVRYIDTELRRDEKRSNGVEGYAVVFNQEADMGWFTEVIDQHALDEADLSDVVLNLNHDNNILLAGTRNGSMSLKIDERGLLQNSEVIDTTQGRDVMKLVDSGLISKMSFAFVIAPDGEEWSERNGKEHRVIRKISRLYDCSLVAFPAYPQTSAWARGNDDELANKHKALMERRAEQKKKLEEILGE